MRKTAILAVFCGFSAVLQGAVHPDAGTTAFSFLRIGAGARPVALGGAYAAVSDDAGALWYNPAGIASYSGRQILTGYRSLWAGGQAGIVAGTMPVEGVGTAGLAAVYERSGQMDRTDIDGAKLGTFRTGAVCITAAFAREFTDVEKMVPSIPYPQKLQAGLAVKFIQSSILSYSSVGLAADIGIRYAVGINKGLTFGAAVQNLGAQLTAYDTETAPLPLTFRGGAAYPLQYLPLLLTYEAVKPVDNYLYHTFGGEFTLTPNLFLRAGFSSADRRDWYISEDDDTFVGAVVGAGFRQHGYSIDAAYTPSGQMGSQFRFSAGRVFD